MRKDERPTGTPDLTIGLGWHVWRDTGRRSSGTTAAPAATGRSPGSTPRKRRASSSSATPRSASTTSAFSPWSRSGPWPGSSRWSRGAAVDEGLQAYAGEYELEPGVTVAVAVWRVSCRQIAGQAEVDYQPWSPTEFFRPGGRHPGHLREGPIRRRDPHSSSIRTASTGGQKDQVASQRPGARAAGGGLTTSISSPRDGCGKRTFHECRRYPVAPGVVVRSSSRPSARGMPPG